MEADFSGYATKAGVKCSDGRTIMQGAFQHQHQVEVPLVWMHGHNDVENVLGHAILEYRPNGDVYTYGFFNNTPKAEHAKQLLEHGDIKKLSIWAGELVERSKKVLHGAIREVSLVLNGANPGAVIENVTIRHSDGDESPLEDEAIIKGFSEIEHQQPPAELLHADDNEEGEEKTDDDGESLQDIYDAMTEEQKDVVHYMVGQAMVKAGAADDEEKDGETDAKQDNVGDADDDKTLNHSNSDKEGNTDMTTRNLFEGDTLKNKDGEAYELTHADMEGIKKDFESVGSLRKVMNAFAEEHLQHGIQDLELLFPEAKAVTNTPEWDKRRTEWVAGVLGGVSKRPFARIKSWDADLTYKEARARGYIKGNVKEEEWFSISKRETTPQTIYKKQKLDRDDIIDITDFDVVMWMKGEMRLMLDEEIARAILVGDGRSVLSPDKIKEEHIRPIAMDDPYYVHSFGVNLEDANSSMEEVMDAIILNRQYYKGTGRPTMYTTQGRIAQMSLLRDDMNRKLYRNVGEIASDLDVDRIVPVEILEEYPDIIAIIVNMSDYTIGMDRGGQVTMFDDFDIDVNQEKYLIETRLSGALTKPKSAMVVYSTLVGDTATVPQAPTWDAATRTLTIPVDATVEYKDENGNDYADGDTVVPAGTNVVVQAWPADTYYFAGGFKTRWSFLALPA